VTGSFPRIQLHEVSQLTEIRNGHFQNKSALPLGPNYILTLNKVSKKKSAQCINATTMKMVRESITVIHGFICKIPSPLDLQPAISPTTDTQTGIINNYTVTEGQCPFQEYQHYLMVNSSSPLRMPHITHDTLQYEWCSDHPLLSLNLVFIYKNHSNQPKFYLWILRAVPKRNDYAKPLGQRGYGVCDTIK
jgi:hypothetical protein